MNRNLKHCQLSVWVLDWINGELLGDGNLRSLAPQTAKFRYGSKHLEYINYVSKTLNLSSIGQSGTIYKRVSKWEGAICCVYHYESLSYCELKLLHETWYPDGKKEVPRGLKLTPLVCRQWYIGDGCLVNSPSVKSRPYIMLSTCGFSVDDIEWLVGQLWEIGILAKRRTRTNEIYITTYSTLDFLNYIGQCPVECYQYKWRY